MSKRQARLRAALIKELQNYRNPHHMSLENGDSHGLIYRCLNGGFSPTLYKKYVRSKPRKRIRYIIEDPTGELTEQGDEQRGEMSRTEYQAYLLRMDREYFGTLPY